MCLCAMLCETLSQSIFAATEKEFFMNILVLCDQFVKGGLETHIATYTTELQKSHKVWLACAHYEPVGIWEGPQVYSDFHFSFYDTIQDLKEDVDRLCAIIRDKQIDVLHVHPWFGLYAACFAAVETGVKLVATIHGLSSLNYNGNLYDELWMEDIFTNAISHAFCVSRNGLDMLGSMHMHNASFLPNAIDMSRYCTVQPAKSHRWAMVSRLDVDKYATVETLVHMLPDLEIDAVDIYGDGTCMAQAQALAESCPKPVRLMGYHTDMHECLRDGYAGVIGLGRCAIEGLSMGLPVLFAGYGKLCGIIDRSCYEKAVSMNFVSERFPSLDAATINAQLLQVYTDSAPYRFLSQIHDDYDVTVNAERMVETIANAPAGIPQYFTTLYQKLLKLNAETAVHESEDVFKILRETLFFNTRNMYLKTQLLQVQLTERKREETAYQLRLAWNDIDQRNRATQTALDAEVSLRTDLYQKTETRLDDLDARISALSASNTQLQNALDEIRQQVQTENTALTTHLDSLTLGFLIRQEFRRKILYPLMRLLGKGD